MNRYGQGQKGVKFVIDEKKHVDLRLRLRHDELSQVKFFKAIVDGYLANDELIINFINNYKEKEKIQSATKRKKSMRLIKDGKEQAKKFAFSEEEIENIFDIIEGEEEIF